MIGSCEQTREHLSAHLEGELTGLRRLRVRMHLAVCSLCAAVAQSLRETIGRLRELDDNFAPAQTPSVAPAVIERLRKLERE
jgi:anti-sigma factor RsiW